MDKHIHFERCIKIGWGLLFAYISLVPFYYLQPITLKLTISPALVFKYLPVLLIIGLCLPFVLSFFRRRLIEVLQSPLFVCVGVYLFVVILSLIGASYPKIGALKLIYYTSSGVFLPWIFAVHFRSSSSLCWMAQWIVWTAAVVACYGILVYVTGRDYIWGNAYVAYNPYYSGIQRASSTIGNAVFTGAYLSLCLPYCLWAFNRHQQKWRRIYGILAILIILGLVLTLSRGAWIAGCIGCLIYLGGKSDVFYAYIKKWGSLQKSVITITVFLLLLPVMKGVGFQEVIDRTQKSFEIRLDQVLNIRTTESFRLAQYGTTWRILEENPLLGIGFGNFTRLFDVYKHPDTPSGYIATTTENMYLMVACETGILGLVVLIVTMYVLMWLVYKGYRIFAPGSGQDLCLASLGAFGGFIVNMATWDALNQPAVRMTFWILVGLALCQLQLIPRTKNEAMSKSARA